MLFPVYISIATLLGLAQELWEGGRGLLCLSCALLTQGTRKERKAVEEEEGPWKGMGFLGRKGTLERNGGAAYSACTDLCPSRKEVRRVPGALSSSGGTYVLSI